MINKIYSIYDSKSETWMQPLFAPNNNVAMRTFSDAVNNEDSIFNRHPEDFTLFYIGDFDDQYGTITPAETPSSLGLAMKFLASEQPQLAQLGQLR